MLGLLADVAHGLVGAVLGNVSLLEAVVAGRRVLAVLHQVTGLAAVVAHSLVGAGGGLLWWCDRCSGDIGEYFRLDYGYKAKKAKKQKGMCVNVCISYQMSPLLAVVAQTVEGAHRLLLWWVLC